MLNNKRTHKDNNPVLLNVFINQRLLGTTNWFDDLSIFFILIIKKNVLNTGNNFYHFHPGYIPEMKGADISLRSVFYRNHIGCSFFQINEKIDY